MSPRPTVWRLALVALALALGAGCGADDAAVEIGDGGADAADAADAMVADSAPDTTAPAPVHARLGLFGFAPSFYELLLSNEDAAPTDAFHFGAYRTGFTWPLPVTGDFDGDGFSSVGFYDPRTREFHLHDELSGAERVVPFGVVAGVPLVGDWDGDGIDELGVYDPTTGVAELEADGATRSVAGPTGLFALGADLDGDGVDGLVYYGAPSFTVHEPVEQTVSLGPPDGYPFAGDFDGDGADELGVFDVANDTFLIFDAFAADAAATVVRVSPVNWVRAPIAGRWRSTDSRPAEVGYPYDDIEPAAVGIDPSGLTAAAAALSSMPNLRSLLVSKGAGLVHESYFHGNSGSIAHNIKSVSKSILATLLLVAREDDTVPDSSILTLLPAEYDDGDVQRRAIRPRHLLTMTSGLTWNEDLISDWYLSDDWVGAAISAPMATDPGAAFSYSTGNTHLGSAILTRAAGVGTDVLARDSILAPLGIVAERWDRDPSGTPVGGAEVTMRPRDMARFGQLFLEEGSPDGARILTTAVVEAIRNEWVPASEIDGDLRYGAWWWIRSFGASDAYFAWGYGGQFIFVFPTLDAVVVVTSRSDVDGETSGRVSYEVFSVITDYIVPAL